MVMRSSINTIPTNTTNEVPNRSLPPRGSQINCEYTDEQIVALQALLEQYESEFDSIRSVLTNLKEEKVKLAQKIDREQAEQGRLQKDCYVFAKQLNEEEEKLKNNYVVGTLSYERQLDVVYELRSKYESCVRKSKVNETKYNTLFITQIYDSNEYEGDVNVYGDPDWDSDVELLHDCGSMEYICPELENTKSVEETITKDGVETLHTVLIDIFDGENINNIECCQSLGGSVITDDSGNVYCSTGVIKQCYPPTVYNSTYAACDEGSGQATFDLSLMEEKIAPLNHTTATFEWFEDAGLTTPITGPTSYVSSDDTVYVKVTSDVDCYSTSSVDLDVLSGPAVFDGTFEGCGSGSISFDLTTKNNKVSPPLFNPDSTVTWYEDAGLTTPITDPTDYFSAGSDVYALVVDEKGCSDTATMTLIVNSC